MQASKLNTIIFCLLITGIVFILVAIIIFLFYVYNKSRVGRYRDIEFLKFENEKNILQARVDIQENIVQRISRELHDNINLSLSLAQSHLNTICWDNKEGAILKVNTASGILNQSSLDLRDISRSLNGDVINEQGLINTLREEVQRIRQTGLFLIDFKVGQYVFLEPEKELAIFRIIQEAFNNIIRHANASHVRLEFQYTSSLLLIKIIDNGKGFTPGEQNSSGRKPGTGLKSMKASANILGGDMEVKSIIGEGTKIQLNIPF